MFVQFLFVILAVSGATASPLDGIESVALLPGTAVEAAPRLYLFPVEGAAAPCPAVVVCPGGGYGNLAIGYEGVDVARWLNSHGVAAFVLQYRVAPHRYPAPLEDAQRAIRLIRDNAGEWKIDPAKVGMLGFSAGGHLVSTAATHFDRGKPEDADPVCRQSCRPDFTILIYPVISLLPAYGHIGSRNNLLGADPDPALVASLCNDTQVTAETPPAFLVHSTGDTGVPSENSVSYYMALIRAGVPAELHIYEQGQHGYGMGKGDPALSTWPDLCIHWMIKRGLLNK